MIPLTPATGALCPKTMWWAKPGSCGCPWTSLSPCSEKFDGIDSLKEYPKQEAPYVRGFFLPNNRSLASGTQVFVGFGKMLASPKTAMSSKWAWMRSLQDAMLSYIN